jgi:hypothetical protein
MAGGKQSTSFLAYALTLKMELVCSSETSIGIPGFKSLFFRINSLFNGQTLCFCQIGIEFVIII